jgi:hypothetical protein
LVELGIKREAAMKAHDEYIENHARRLKKKKEKALRKKEFNKKKEAARKKKFLDEETAAAVAHGKRMEGLAPDGIITSGNFSSVLKSMSQMENVAVSGDRQRLELASRRAKEAVMKRKMSLVEEGMHSRK